MPAWLASLTRRECEELLEIVRFWLRPDAPIPSRVPVADVRQLERDLMGRLEQFNESDD
jgi:hypothetical protein